MRARREFRDRDDVDIAVLDALVDRGEEGATVFELRSHVDADIDEIEAALARLKRDDLIDVDGGGDRPTVLPAERAVPDRPRADPEPSIIEQIRERLPF
ncbi:MAG: DUF6432 family protein [Halobacteriales archaeon]